MSSPAFNSSSENVKSQQPGQSSTSGELSADATLAYVMRPEATRKCWAREVHAMPSSVGKNSSYSFPEYYLLGSRCIPVRTVQIVGMVVGVVGIEEGKKIKYFVDDGSSVVDCFITKPTPHPKHVASATESSQRIFISGPPLESLEKIKDGDIVMVTGRIIPRAQRRELRLSSITRCSSPNDQAKHWQELRQLYLSEYDYLETLGPFVIPDNTPESAPLQPTPFIVQSPNSAEVYPSPLRPSNSSGNVSSVPREPSQSLDKRRKPPPRLTHPTRLPHGQLTENTFRMYLRWYMQHAPAAYEASCLNTCEPTQGYPSSMAQTRRTLTTAHLHRVPELVLLARRIVRQIERTRSLNPQKHKSKDIREAPENKIFRLFRHALRQLVLSGAVVLWNEGQPIPPPCLELGDSSSSWAFDWNRGTAASASSRKISSTLGTFDENTIIGTSTEISSSRRDWREEVNAFLATLPPLSEANNGDESYAFVCPDILASHVQKAVRTLRKAVATKRRMREPTFQTIADYLKRSDHTWNFVSVDDVERTMKVLGGLEEEECAC